MELLGCRFIHPKYRIIHAFHSDTQFRKGRFLLAAFTVSATLLSGCKASDSVDNSAVKSEAIEIYLMQHEKAPF